MRQMCLTRVRQQGASRDEHTGGERGQVGPEREVFGRIGRVREDEGDTLRLEVSEHLPEIAPTNVDRDALVVWHGAGLLVDVAQHRAAGTLAVANGLNSERPMC